VIAAVHLRPAADADPDEFREQAAGALRAFAERPGYLGGTLGRATDDAQAWLLLTEWESVGAYRRALGSFGVKMATPVLSRALDQPSAFEELLRIDAAGEERETGSDRASDADWAPRHPPV
jgi:heme oxygenase (mycobilin-producing)